jgi:predicted nucleotidyltransferase component of viral defense system
MKPLHNRLQEARKRLGLPWEVLERDYVLSWLLAGVSRIETLRDTLAFKGGTALRKCFFGDYRFSEDLDFSGIENFPTGDEMKREIRGLCKLVASLLDEYAPVEMVCERYTERDPHPGGQEAFTIRVRLPWQRTPQTRVMVETSVDEKVLKPMQKRSIIHEYGEPLAGQVQVYALEEIVAEKLRAILQHVQKLHERGWSRSRARDYYDLWYVLGAYQNQLDFSGFSSFLHAKCAIRNVSFKGPDDFFEKTMLNYVEKTWEQWLGPLVPNLPDFDTVIGELRPRIAFLLSPAG